MADREIVVSYLDRTNMTAYRPADSKKKADPELTDAKIADVIARIHAGKDPAVIKRETKRAVGSVTFKQIGLIRSLFLQKIAEESEMEEEEVSPTKILLGV
jgi:hypothetical protein